jgi:four helix bundle suffix protein
MIKRPRPERAWRAVPGSPRIVRRGVGHSQVAARPPRFRIFPESKRYGLGGDLPAVEKTMAGPERLIPKHGGYRRLKSFQLAQLIYDVTVRFCDRYIDRRSRTHDQMVQAARSGAQNIAEGSKASATSKKTELKLTNVARASLEELRLDYEDFLRQRRLPIWDRRDARRQALIDRRCATADDVAAWVKECGRRGQAGPGGRPTYAEIAANAALTLIAVACALLDRQIAAQAAAFEEEGGFTERLYRVRTARRATPSTRPTNSTVSTKSTKSSKSSKSSQE